ncbi:hypothetical protein PEBR_25838 [Penicillium brasilianum]|uniref:Uncharacterized protein n=1 Tax=Penicillium brasilianum TaxID=104259 RepID=A0A1S9RK88_PENBI|nr:hypothetical protein PEBR_25838 [Penicillium brasilianum]
MACRRFNSVGIKTTDIASFTPSLRTVLETTLSQDASPQALDLYLPRIRAIVIDMLHGMKQKQSLLRGEAQEVPAGTREPPVTTAEGSHPLSAAQATTTTTPEDYLKRPRDDRHWSERQGYQKVLDAMDIVKDQHHKAGRFDFWIPAFEVAIDTHMQARGSDRKLDRSQVTETLLREYCYSTTCLINMLVSACDDDLKFRCHIRAQLNACGIQRILPKLERFEYGAIDRQIERFRDDEAIDYEDLLHCE